MKKLITIILSLAMILPAAAIADTEQELLGTWVGTRDVFQGDVTYFFVRLYADHEAIYETRSFDKADTEGISLVNFGTWELKEDGVHITYKNFWDRKQTDELVLGLTQAHYLAMELAASYILFEKLPGTRPIPDVHLVENWD